MSDTSNTWAVQIVKVDTKAGYHGPNQELVIEAGPEYGNAKKWKGEFRFALTPEQFDALKEALDREGQKARLVEVARSELVAIKEEYEDKLAHVLKETGLTEEDIDPWHRHL